MSLPLFNHDQPAFGEGQYDQDSSNARRGTRACDRCRKTKSKCEPGPQGVCKSCYATGSACTYQGPSFKRGPPKGYIQAIERRWHQVEALLGVITAAPQARDMISTLRQDPMAREILDRVNTGPYGPTHRHDRSPSSPTENLYATVMRTEHPDERRSRRQSRVSREIVSVEDSSIMEMPTRSWQEQLLARLARPTNTSGYSTPISFSSPGMSTPGAGPSSLSLESGDSGPTRRTAVDMYYTPERSPMIPENQELYVMPDEHDQFDETVTSFGRLSIDENKEIRYHGTASGLHLLAKGERTDDHEQRQNGIWKFERPRPDLSYEDDRDLQSHENSVHVTLPPIEVQLHLLDVYFTYLHPVFPVLHKQDFMASFGPFYSQSVSPQPAPQTAPSQSLRNPLQQISNLLLLSIFSLAARYTTTSTSASQDDASLQYAIGARQILNQIYQFSRPSTCQALLILGVREFGIGAMEQGWLYTGIAMRMAIDLGMNHDADNWTDESAKELFTPVEKQIRRHIWWACCIADKLSSVWLGRPITLRQSDHSTRMPEVVETEEYELWQPCPPDALGPEFSPSASRIPSCYRAACNLSALMSEIMEKVYPVRSRTDFPPRKYAEELEGRLQQWYIDLPEHLRFDVNVHSDGKSVPLPHILTLHVEYWASVLLLHRAFIPKWNDNDDRITSDPLPLRSFDTCQNAAARITSLVTIYAKKYGMERAPPFLSIYLQSAGIMHVVTLLRRPHNHIATIGLKQCISALESMEIVWPSATSVLKLLEGAKVQLDNLSGSAQRYVDRQKRSAEEAGMDKAPTHVRPPPAMEHAREATPTASTSNPSFNFDDLTFNMMAQTFGTAIPTPLEPNVPYYSGGGYQPWWPRTTSAVGGNAGQGRGAPFQQQTYDMRMQQPEHGGATSETTEPMQGPGLPSRDDFTFAPNQLSADFVRGVHYPVLDFSHLFPQSGPDPFNPPKE